MTIYQQGPVFQQNKDFVWNFVSEGTAARRGDVVVPGLMLNALDCDTPIK